MAIRTVSRDDEPLVLQWCMSCRRVEVLRLDEYDWRARLAELWKDDVPDQRDRPDGLDSPERLDLPDRPDGLDSPDRREPDKA